MNYVLNARDFGGAQVTSARDDVDWFTWWAGSDLWGPEVGEVDEYARADFLYTQVAQDIYPEVDILANVAHDTYRLWIHQSEIIISRAKPQRTPGNFL